MANRRVSADVAHDLRKPLARILRRLEGVQAEDASLEQARAAAQAAIGEIEGVLEMFDALLRIGEVEAGARRAAFRPLDLAAVAREVVEAFEPVAQEEGRALTARLDDPLPIAGDKELLTQMIANLLDNALGHTPAGVRIEVAGERARNGVALSVADDGPGVPAEDLEKIFQPFYRADAARASSGTGLGLSLVAAIAELHGLTCSASDNRPGLRVTLEPPMRKSDGESDSVWRGRRRVLCGRADGAAERGDQLRGGARRQDDVDRFHLAREQRMHGRDGHVDVLVDRGHRRRLFRRKEERDAIPTRFAHRLFLSCDVAGSGDPLVAIDYRTNEIFLVSEARQSDPGEVRQDQQPEAMG